jgi:BCD family chlorophyll transporter-like MFS transporter
VVSLMYVMLLLGTVLGSLVFSVLLAEFSPQRLVQVVQGTAMVVLALNAFALWKQEPRNPQRAAAMKSERTMPFGQAGRVFIQNRRARRFLWATGLGTMAFNMQDVVLEPYGGEILHLSVSATSGLTALLASGALLGYILSGRSLARGIDPLRLAGYGAMLGLPAFSAVIFAAPTDASWLFRLGAFGIGFSGGLFAVGTLLAAMHLEQGRFVGMALGAWGAVQAMAAGLSMFIGGALRDIVSTLATQGALGTALAQPATGYSAVYHLEMLLLFITLIAIGPLVGRRSTSPNPESTRLGLADLPG